MSALTLTRRFAIEADIEQIVVRLRALQLEGPQAAEILDELHDALDGSLYQEIGLVDLNDIAGRISREYSDFSPVQAEAERDEDLRAAA